MLFFFVVASSSLKDIYLRVYLCAALPYHGVVLSVMCK